MSISRRNFLAAAPFAGGAIASVVGHAGAQTGSPDRLGAAGMVPRMSLASFDRAVNTEFVFWSKNDIGVKLMLDAAENSLSEFSERNRHGGENFVLKFSGPQEHPLRQDIYTVRHPELGKFDLFITEGESSARPVYLAVINHLSR